MYRSVLTIALLAGLLLAPAQGHAAVEKVRAMFRTNPATSFTIGWNQLTGANAVLKYDTVDHGTDAAAYPNTAAPDRVVDFRDMLNHFVRLEGLAPDTKYYFVIQDSEGVSQRYWVLTAPDAPEKFTYVTGGDTKSTGTALLAGQESNRMVAKLRPLFVMFTGDFNSDNGTNTAYWNDWLNNWSTQTTTADGRLIPILAVHGNHENGDYTTINKLFDTVDTDSEYSYYSMNFGGELLHVVSLNSELQNGDAPSGAFAAQAAWLESDLQLHASDIFKIAGYHKPLRPHTSSKAEQIFLQDTWSPMFDTYGLTVGCESDSHMHKITFPLSHCEDGEPGCFQNFVRNDDFGVMYVGEGSWGAGPRASDDNKPWTIHSQSMNQIKWHTVYPDDPNTDEFDAKLEIRTVITYDDQGHVDGVEALTEANKYDKIPDSINLVVLPFFGDHMEMPFTAPTGDVPSAPINLVAQVESFSEIQLDWQNVSGTDEVSNIEVEMKIGDGDWKNVAFLPATDNSYLVEQLVESGAHFFRVRGTNLFGPSAWSEVVEADIPVDTRLKRIFIQGYTTDGQPAPGDASAYSGAVDIAISEEYPVVTVDGPVTYVNGVPMDIGLDNPFSLMFADAELGKQEQSLIRFNGIIGLLPENAEIDQAVLTLVGADSTNGIISLHRMLKDWPALANWAYFGAGGIEQNDVDSALDADDSRASGIQFLQTVTFDVTTSVKAWQQTPEANFGWVLINSSTDGWDTPQSEIPSPFVMPEVGVFEPVQPRPALTVFYTLPGDLNNDGNVTRDDYMELRPYLNQPASACPRCDLDDNGVINVLDARKLIQLTR